MRINGLNPLLVVFAVCSLGFSLFSGITSEAHQAQITSKKQHSGADENEESQNLPDGKIFARNNVEEKGKHDESREGNIVLSLVKHTKERSKVTHTEKEPKRKQSTKSKPLTDERTHKSSHKKRTRKWNDILSSVKTKQDSNKLLNTKISKKDKKLQHKDHAKKNERLHVKDKPDSKTSDRSSDKKSNEKKKKKNNKHRQNKETSNLISKEKLESLREALLVHPFRVWKFKDRFNSMDDIGIHEGLLQDVVENKWSTRLKHKLFKVFKGENLHLAIIGGSNTAGGGIQEDEGRTDGLFFRVISDWWRKTITPITGSHFKTRQIAMGGTGSDFFQYCHQSYIQKDVDLILLEMSVNDLHELPYNVNLSLPIEQLTRQLLEYPTEPAVIYVNLLSGRSYYQGCTNLEDYGQRLLSDAYKVTTFSWRDAVCPVIGGKYRAPLPSCKVVCKDGHHINQLGHAHISLMVINLFRDLLLGNIARIDEMSREVFHDEILLPKPVFIAEPSKIITEPICWTTVTPNFQKKIINNSMEVGVMENYGFEFLHYKSIGGRCVAKNACRADAYSGWTGKDMGASLTLSFTVPPLGRKREIHSRSVVFATRTCTKCGQAEVWLDDDVVNRRRIRATSQYAQTLCEIIALRVNPGDHTLNVKVVQPGIVTVVGVMLGPPDGPY